MLLDTMLFPSWYAGYAGRCPARVRERTRARLGARAVHGRRPGCTPHCKQHTLQYAVWCSKLHTLHCTLHTFGTSYCTLHTLALHTAHLKLHQPYVYVIEFVLSMYLIDRFSALHIYRTLLRLPQNYIHLGAIFDLI